MTRSLGLKVRVYFTIVDLFILLHVSKMLMSNRWRLLSARPPRLRLSHVGLFRAVGTP